jgi:protease II
VKLVLYIKLCAVIVLCFAETNRYHRGNLIIENIPDIPSTVTKELRAYQNTRSASFCDWLPGDKGMLIHTRFGDVSQIHHVTMPGAARTQLTFFSEPVAEGLVCPDTAAPYFLFAKDSAGNERYQIYKFNYQTSTCTMLTDGQSRHMAVVWSHQGDRFAFASTMRNGKDYDVYTGTLAGLESFKCIAQADGYWYPIEFSPDDRTLLVTHYIASDQSYLYAVDLKTMKMRQINPSDQNISYGQAHWARDGKGIFFVSDQYGEFRQLMYHDLATQHNEILTSQIPWDVTEFEISPQEDMLAFMCRENYVNVMYFLDIATQTITQARLPYGMKHHMDFKPDGEMLAMVVNTPKSPSDVYTLNLRNRTFTRWTQSEVASLDTSGFSEPELVYYPTFDSIDNQPRTIPMFYYKPSRCDPPYPVLINVHGGPAAQYNPWFSPILQYYLNGMGIAVLRPNVRGSTGLGRTYMTLDNGYDRENAVKDIGSLLDWIQKQPELDASRIAITGGSYGGYMVLASMVHYSDRLKCGIESCGISNFVTFLENTGIYRQDLRRVEYGDERDPEMREFLNAISPLNNAHKITKPLFITQGLNDPRVPISEAEQIVKAVRSNGVDVWYVCAEDEGHGFAKKLNQDYRTQAQVLFLRTYLLR